MLIKSPTELSIARQNTCVTKVSLCASVDPHIEVFLILILLVFAHEVVQIRGGLRELHLVHALPSVPMQESLAAEHGVKSLTHSEEHLLQTATPMKKLEACQNFSALQAFKLYAVFVTLIHDAPEE